LGLQLNCSAFLVARMPRQEDRAQLPIGWRLGNLDQGLRILVCQLRRWITENRNKQDIYKTAQDQWLV
jgi:hypothetical protein